MREHTHPHRRAVLVGLIGFGAMAGSALAAPAQRVRAVRVDAAPLAAKGVSRYAARVAAAAEPAMRAQFAGLMTADRRAPTAVLQISSISLSSNPGRSFRMLDGEDDWISGAGLLVGPNGAVLRRVPLSISNRSVNGPPVMLLQDEDRRMHELVDKMAYWFARELSD